jgi:hypothetical protein
MTVALSDEAWSVRPASVKAIPTYNQDPRYLKDPLVSAVQQGLIAGRNATEEASRWSGG